MRLSPTRYSHNHIFSLTTSCVPRDSISLCGVHDSRCLSDWYRSRWCMPQVDLDSKATPPTADLAGSSWLPVRLLRNQHVVKTLCNPESTDAKVLSKTAGSARHLYVYIHPRIDQTPTLKSRSTAATSFTRSNEKDRRFYLLKCLEIISLEIETARLKLQAPFGPLRLETLAPAITYELRLTWGLSPRRRCQEGALDLRLR